MAYAYPFRRTAAILATLAMALTGAIVVASPAQAAPGDLVFGVVSVDANKNGVRDAAGPVGEVDLPLVGVAVTLRAADALAADPAHPGWSTVSDASGAWSFADSGEWATSFSGPYTVTLNVDDVGGDLYAVHPSASADNAFAAIPGENQRADAAFTAAGSPVELNALVWPAWKLSLILLNDAGGWEGKSVYTGTPPFDSADVEPGEDSSRSNGRVRVGDVVEYNWSLAASYAEALADATESVIFEQTIHLAGGARANFDRIPAICMGSSPASSIVAKPSETVLSGRQAPPAGTTEVVLSCNIGAAGIDAATTIIPATVWISPDSPNGSEFTTQARAYGIDPEGSGVATAQPAPSAVNGPIEITAAPRWDIEKRGPYNVNALSRDIDGQSVPGRLLTYLVMISTDQRTGVEAFAQPLTFTERFWATRPGAVPGEPASLYQDFEYYMVSCGPAYPNASAAAMGALYGVYRADQPESSVLNSGTCGFERSGTVGTTTEPYTVTLSGIDTSGAHYPTSNLAGADLSGGPYYVASYSVSIFVPNSELDRAQAPVDDGRGALTVYNQVADFDPLGASGSSNFGSGYEPGWCDGSAPGADGAHGCEAMPGGEQSNNVAGPRQLVLAPAVGHFTWRGKTFVSPAHAWISNSTLSRALPGSALAHDGAGVVQPGQVFASWVGMFGYNHGSGAPPITNLGICDVFDNTTLKLSELRHLTGTGNAASFGEGRYAWIHDNRAAAGMAGQLPIQDDYLFQFASVGLGTDVANNGVYDQLTGRYGGDWSTQRMVNCGDPSIVWYSSPAAVPGGVDAVNAVRVTSKAGVEIPANGGQDLWIALEQRDRFHGGPSDGELIPNGTVAANFGQVTSSALWPDWSMLPGQRRYQPQPENAPPSNDGDRWTVQRAEASLVKRTISVGGIGYGAADVDQTGVAIAGGPVIWEIMPVIRADSAQPGVIEDVVITDTLPRHVTYNDAATAALSGGTPADTWTVNPDGSTTLIWNLGDRTPNQPIPSRIIYTETDPFTPHGYAAVNSATITGHALVPHAQHTDEHTVIMEQTGQLQLKKSVDQVLDFQDDTQEYTLQVRNFSTSLTVAPPVLYEVLPHNGDATNSASVNRTPASDFAGTSTLTGPPSVGDFGGAATVDGAFWYTTIASDLIPQDRNADTNPAIWVQQAGVEDWAAVTGFKFVSTTALTNFTTGDASGLSIVFTITQSGNAPGDRYSDRFTAFSETFRDTQGVYQLLTSNQTTVRVVGFSLGDLVWVDEDNDGVFTAGTDTTVAGVVVQVRNASGVLVASTVTDADGRWVVNDLPEGDYYVTIPASQFAVSGPLHGFTAGTAGFQADADTDLNESADHHAVMDGGVLRSSGLVTLSATVDGSVISGDEPLGDNVAGLSLSPLTTDAFTNLTVDLALQRVPGYEFTKTSDPVSGTPVAADGSITYTLTGTNTGNTPLDPVTVSDDLSGLSPHWTGAPTAVAQIDGTTVTAPTITGTTLNWTGALAPGESVVITYTVTLDDAEGVIVNNRASSTATPPAFFPPITPPTVETHHPTPGFTFHKSALPATGTPVAVGETVTYTVEAFNAGQTVLNPVVVTDDLTEVLAFATMTTAPVAFLVDGGVETVSAIVPQLSGSTLTWTGSLQVDQTVRIRYTVTVDDDMAGSVLSNTASATGTPPGLPPLAPPEVTTQHPVPGFELAKTADPVSGTVVRPEQTITYLVVGTNTGATVLDPVIITDDLSQVLTFADLTVDPVAEILDAADVATPATAPAVTGTSWRWDGVLAVGERVQISYTVTVHQDAWSKQLHNVATASATPPGGTLITPPPVETTHRTPPVPIIPLTGETLAGIGITSATLMLGLGTALLLLRRRRNHAHAA